MFLGRENTMHQNKTHGSVFAREPIGRSHFNACLTSVFVGWMRPCHCPNRATLSNLLLLQCTHGVQPRPLHAFSLYCENAHKNAQLGKVPPLCDRRQSPDGVQTKRFETYSFLDYFYCILALRCASLMKDY